MPTHNRLSPTKPHKVWYANTVTALMLVCGISAGCRSTSFEPWSPPRWIEIEWGEDAEMAGAKLGLMATEWTDLGTRDQDEWEADQERIRNKVLALAEGFRFEAANNQLVAAEQRLEEAGLLSRGGELEEAIRDAEAEENAFLGMLYARYTTEVKAAHSIRPLPPFEEFVQSLRGGLTSTDLDRAKADLARLVSRLEGDAGRRNAWFKRMSLVLRQARVYYDLVVGPSGEIPKPYRFDATRRRGLCRLDGLLMAGGYTFKQVAFVRGDQVFASSTQGGDLEVVVVRYGADAHLAPVGNERIPLREAIRIGVFDTLAMTQGRVRGHRLEELEEMRACLWFCIFPGAVVQPNCGLPETDTGRFIRVEIDGRARQKAVDVSCKLPAGEGAEPPKSVKGDDDALRKRDAQRGDP